MKMPSFVILMVIALTWPVAVNAEDKTKEKWQEYRSNHFIIYFREAPNDFIKAVEETAEYSYQEITRSLGFFRTESWSWDQRAKIYIYDSREDYIEQSRNAKWSYGAAAAFDKVIRTFPAAHGFFDSTLPHELGHIIFREFVGFKSDIPIWMDEGVAMYQEKAKRWGANQFVKKAIEEKRFISLSELTKVERLDETTPPEYIDLFYAEAASIVYYLINELGQYQFVELCKELKKAKRFDQAIRETYRRFDNLDELNNAWVSYLKRQ